jgi:hypothetical protein
VDDAALPSPADPAAPAGTSPWLVVASAHAPASGEVRLRDPRRGEFRLPLATLTAARSAFRPLKHRAAVVRPSSRAFDLPVAVKEALRATAANMLEPEMRNFGLPGLTKWAEELADERGKRGWTALFCGDTRAGALAAIACAANEAVSGRRLYAAFLREAGEALAEPALANAAPGYETSAERWRALARAAERDTEFVALAAHVHEIETAERAAMRPLADWAA